MHSAIIFNIQRFSLNDGPGIRTTVFIKGCPLNCLWCHNPESKAKEPQIMYSSEKCTVCGRCAQICHTKAQKIADGIHIFNREMCDGCGKCTEVCPTRALETCGKEMTSENVLSEVVKDRLFYETSGGGVTLSGGEPLYSFDFTLELLRLCKENGIHTAIETSGAASAEKIRAIAEYTDLFLFDCKISDENEHKKFTGAEKSTILSNLHLLNSLGKEIVLRCPIIPGINDKNDHLRAIGELSSRLESVIAVDIEPYHPLGEGKAERLGVEYPLSGKSFPPKETVSEWIAAVSKYTNKPVRQG